MKNRIPRVPVRKQARTAPAKQSSVDEAKMMRETVASEVIDPAWNELGRTCVVKAKQNGAENAETVDTPANFTELSPARVPGKELGRLGDFQLKKKLGEGAMGAVYLAEQISFNNRRVALKILFPHVASNPKLVARLQREGRVMFHLDHPNIVQAFAVDEAEGCHFVAMEFVSGQSAQQWLNQLGKMPVGDAIRITLDCARAIGYAHSMKLIHRDIKPDNILLTKEGVVKVADLGMVKTHDEDLSLTQTGHAVGTPWFMPLEQARNAKESDGRCDIYALGCTLYALLTGKPPFVGATIVDVIKAKELGTFAPARQANANVPERLDLILAKMTAKLPKHRYQTCDDLITDLESLDLASATLSFVQTEIVVKKAEDEACDNLQATIETTAADANGAKNTPIDGMPTLDPDVWYIQMKTTKGVVARKCTTAQLQIMLEEGVIQPKSKISHSEKDGFRALATFKEFQGKALGKTTKKAADSQTSRYRTIRSKLDEKQREREEADRAANREESAVGATARYWLNNVLMFLPIGMGIIFFIAVLSYIASEPKPTMFVPIVPGVAFLGSLVYAFFRKR